jgi:hypothetical protein
MTTNAHVTVAGKALEISGRLVKTARLEDEAFDDLDQPARLIEELKRSQIGADIFTFCQRLPHQAPRFLYPMDWESIAVLPVTTYEQWWTSQINNKTRNLVVKARKKGVVLKSCVFDDEFVRGITAIFNETPLRQERPFLHYGKTFETIKVQFARYLFREDIVGAYLGDELIGFIMLANAGRFATLTQIISMQRHRDKSPNNALIAKAVELCAQRHIPHLVYALWPRGSLREFKRHNGFEEVKLPRYFVPLTAAGQLAVRLRLYRNPVEYLPEPTIMYLRGLRSQFYAYRYREAMTDRSSSERSAASEVNG